MHALRTIMSFAGFFVLALGWLIALVYLAALIKVLRDDRRRKRAEKVEARRPTFVWLPEDHWWNRWINGGR